MQRWDAHLLNHGLDAHPVMSSQYLVDVCQGARCTGEQGSPYLSVASVAYPVSGLGSSAPFAPSFASARGAMMGFEMAHQVLRRVRWIGGFDVDSKWLSSSWRHALLLRPDRQAKNYGLRPKRDFKKMFN